MAGPTPLGATHRIQGDVQMASGNVHHIRWWCNAVTSLDTTGYSLVNPNTGVSDTGFSEAVVELVTLLQAFYDAGVTIGNFVLQKFAAGAWVTLAGESYSHIGTAGGAETPAQQITFTFRALGNKQVKSILLETVNPYTGKQSVFTGSTAYDLYVQSYLNPVNPAIGSFVESRGAGYMVGVISAVNDINDRLRRKLGLS